MQLGTMTSDLLIPLDLGCPLEKVHSFYNGISSVFFPDGKHGPPDFVFPV